MALSVGSWSAVVPGFDTSDPSHLAIRSLAETPLDGLVMAALRHANLAPFQNSLYYAVALKLDGAGGVTVGAESSVDLADDEEVFASIDISALKTDGTMCAVYYMDDVDFVNNIEARTISVNTSTLALTVNAVLEIPTDSGLEDHTSIDRIDDTHLFVAHNKWVFGGGRLNCYKLTESGGTLTASAALTLDSDTEIDRRIYTAVLSTSRALVFWNTDLGPLQVALVDISGANPILVDGPDTIDAAGIVGVTTNANKTAVNISSTKAVFTYRNGLDVKLIVVENNADTIVLGTPVTVNSSGNRIAAIGRQDETRIICSYRASSLIENFAIDGTNITADGNGINLPNSPTGPITNSLIALAQISGSTVSWIVLAQDGNQNGDTWAAEVQDEIEVVDPTGGSLNRSWLGRAMPRTNRHRPRPLFGLRRRY